MKRREAAGNIIRSLDIAQRCVICAQGTVLNYPEMKDELTWIADAIGEILCDVEEIRENIPEEELGCQI